MAIRRLAPAALLLAAVVLPPTALAKGELRSIRVCGASACKTFVDAKVLREASGGGDRVVYDIPPASEYYALDFTAGSRRWSHTTRDYYVPRVRMLRSTGSGHWLRLAPARARAFERLTRELAPFPKPQLTAVRVGGTLIRDGASSYLKLLELQTRARVPFSNGSLTVELRSAQPSPWTQPDDVLVFFPKEDVLQRETQWIQLPADAAAAIEQGEPLDRSAGNPAWLVWLVGVLLAAGAVAGIAAVRARRLTQTSPAYHT